jgi:hypothetical protein
LAGRYGELQAWSELRCVQGLCLPLCSTADHPTGFMPHVLENNPLPLCSTSSFVSRWSLPCEAVRFGSAEGSSEERQIHSGGAPRHARHRSALTHPAGTVSVAKKPGFAMSLWLHSHDGEDYLSEAGAMNVWIIKEAADGCEWFRGLQLNLARLDPLSLTLPLPSSVVDLCGSRRLV